jgi:hypothetical protein
MDTDMRHADVGVGLGIGMGGRMGGGGGAGEPRGTHSEKYSIFYIVHVLDTDFSETLPLQRKMPLGCRLPLVQMRSCPPSSSTHPPTTYTPTAPSPACLSQTLNHLKPPPHAHMIKIYI